MLLILSLSLSPFSLIYVCFDLFSDLCPLSLIKLFYLVSFRLGVFSLYYANVSVGTPSLDFLVALDTGSDLFWLPCECSSCFTYLNTSNGGKVFKPTSQILKLMFSLMKSIGWLLFCLSFYSLCWIIIVQMIQQRAQLFPALALCATDVLQTKMFVLMKWDTCLLIPPRLATWLRTYCTWPLMIHYSNLLRLRLLLGELIMFHLSVCIFFL